MKIHDSLIDRICSLAETYGGHRNEYRLKEEIKKLDIAVYRRQSGEEILVNQRDIENYLKGK